MKRIVRLAALGLVVAGCGSAHKAASNVTTLPRSDVYVSSDPDRLLIRGTATIPHVKPGTQIACKGWQRETETTVPALPAPPADEVEKAGGGGRSGTGRIMSLEFKYFSNGMLTVICRKKA
jgi:hypothetical protein